MHYQVRFVDDDALPADVRFAFARAADGTYLFVRSSCINRTTGRCDALTQAWRVWQSVQLEQPAGALQG